MKTKMKKTIKTAILAATITTLMGTANAGSFSWYKIKALETDASVFSNAEITSSTSLRKTKEEEKKVEDYIWNKFKVVATKSKPSDMVLKANETRLIFGMEYQNNPTYTETTLVPSIDPTTGAQTLVSESKEKSLSNVGIYVKGKLDLSSIGMAGTDKLNTKVTLTNDAIDIEGTRRLYGEFGEGFSAEAGLGVKTVTKGSAVFEKGFYGYGVASVNYVDDSWTISGGIKSLFDKPDVYRLKSDQISPFISAGFNF